jgi:hypothetical protein
MTKVTVAVDGLRETVRDLERSGVELDDLKDVFEPIAQEGADTLRPLLPSVSGALRASVRGNRAKNKATVTIGRAKVRYAGPIIYGWKARNIRPSRAVERHDAVMEQKAPELLEKGLIRIFDKYGIGE